MLFYNLQEIPVNNEYLVLLDIFSLRLFLHVYNRTAGKEISNSMIRYNSFILSVQHDWENIQTPAYGFKLKFMIANFCDPGVLHSVLLYLPSLLTHSHTFLPLIRSFPSLFKYAVAAF